jgi:hypothetical protein
VTARFSALGLAVAGLGALVAGCADRGEPEHPRMIPVVGAARLAAELASRSGPVVVEFHTVW